MPLYDFYCEGCVTTKELLQLMDTESPLCPNCQIKMQKKISFPALVKMKGQGGYPSRRKYFQGTAPYTTKDQKGWSPYENNTPAFNNQRYSKE